MTKVLDAPTTRCSPDGENAVADIVNPWELKIPGTTTEPTMSPVSAEKTYTKKLLPIGPMCGAATILPSSETEAPAINPTRPAFISTLMVDNKRPVEAFQTLHVLSIEQETRYFLLLLMAALLSKPLCISVFNFMKSGVEDFPLMIALRSKDPAKAVMGNDIVTTMSIKRKTNRQLSVLVAKIDLPVLHGYGCNLDHSTYLLSRSSPWCAYSNWPFWW